MGIQGELSREDIAFIESMVGSEMLAQLQGNSGEIGGGKLWQHELLNSWTNGQELYSFLDNEYRIKELLDEGYSPEEAAAKVGKEEFLTTLASILVGGESGKKPSTNKVTDGKTSVETSNKDKGKGESGKQGQTSDNKPNTDKDLSSSAIVGQKSLDQLPKNVQDMYIKYSQSDWKGGVSGQSPGTKAGGRYNNDPPSLPTTDKSGNAISYKEYDVNNKLPQEKRDAERFVRGSDGSVYYTKDHYESFIKVK